MSDVNTTIIDIDRAMDCFDAVQFKVTDFVNMIKYDITELGREIYYKLQQLRDELEELCDQLENARRNNRDASEIEEQITKLRRRIKKVEQLKSRQMNLDIGFKEDYSQLVNSIKNQAAAGNREMAEYLMGIQKIESPNGNSNLVSVSGASGVNGDYFVVFIDSSKYPQSAEHIRACIQMGYSDVLTLNREGADDNRKLSLAGIETMVGMDRDEYPPAAFMEGGSGVHVAHILSGDNRGSGSSFGHQLANASNGARVRFRVI